MPAPLPPRVSIILPARDAEATLARALESCLAQTFGDFELIAADDQSRDGTPEILEAFARRDPRVRTVKTGPPGGLVPALRLACQAARGGLLARMDADDFSHPERLAEQVRFLDARPEIAACGCGVRIAGGPGGADAPTGEGFQRYAAWLNGLAEPGRIAAERFVESPLAHPSVLMRREAFEAAGGYRDPEWAEDYDLWLRMMDRGLRLAKVSRVLLDWTDGPGRLTRTDGRYSLRLFLKAKAHYLARLPAVRERGAMVSGAGPTGKKLGRFLLAEGVRLESFLDVSPRRTGKLIAGVPVLPAVEAMPSPGPETPVQIVATGRGNQGETVARMFEEWGFVRGRDLFRAA